MTPSDFKALLANQRRAAETPQNRRKRPASAKTGAGSASVVVGHLPPIARPDVSREAEVFAPPSEVLRPVMLVLPYPPSANRLYRVGRNGRPYKSTEHRDYMASTHRATLSVAPWPRGVELDAVVRLYRPIKRGDIDNPIKALFDALNGRAWEDDSQVVDLHITRRDDKVRPRVEVEIRRTT